MFADLHIHTEYSDGKDKPAEIIAKSVQIGLKSISITDHDSVEAYSSAVPEAARCGIDLLAGVELSTDYEGQDIHILAYCLDPLNTLVQEYLKTFRSDRLKRAKKILAKLQQLNINIGYEKLQKYEDIGAMGRPHVAQAMLDGGYVGSIAEAFELYIGVGKPAYVPRLKYSPGDMVKLIRKLGGVPVLAHPGISCGDDLIKLLLADGLQGLEVYHPEHTEVMKKHYFQICQRFSLIETGGSDYHGADSKWHGQLGQITVPYTVVQRLRDLAAANIKELNSI